MEFSVITYNMHKGRNIFGRSILSPMKLALKKQNTDVIFLQEVQTKQGQGFSQEQFLAQGHCEHICYGKNVDYVKKHHGNALLSKVPFSFHENIILTGKQYFSRSLLHGVIALGGKRIHLLCMHLSLRESERKKQTEVLCQRIREHVPLNEPLVIGGDFNDWPGNIHRHFHQDLGLKEVFKDTQGHHAKTFPSFFPLFPLDRLYYRGLHFRQADVLSGNTWFSLSDHLPIKAIFEI